MGEYEPQHPQAPHCRWTQLWKAQTRMLPCLRWLTLSGEAREQGVCGDHEGWNLVGQSIGEYEPQQPEGRGLPSITEATYPDAQCLGEYEPQQSEARGLLSITEATCSGARRSTSFVLPPIHHPLRLPALRHRRGYVVV